MITSKIALFICIFLSFTSLLAMEPANNFGLNGDDLKAISADKIRSLLMNGTIDQVTDKSITQVLKSEQPESDSNFFIAYDHSLMTNSIIAILVRLDQFACEKEAKEAFIKLLKKLPKDNILHLSLYIFSEKTKSMKELVIKHITTPGGRFDNPSTEIELYVKKNSLKEVHKASLKSIYNYGKKCGTDEKNIIWTLLAKILNPHYELKRLENNFFFISHISYLADHNLHQELWKEVNWLHAKIDIDAINENLSMRHLDKLSKEAELELNKIHFALRRQLARQSKITNLLTTANIEAFIFFMNEDWDKANSKWYESAQQVVKTMEYHDLNYKFPNHLGGFINYTEEFEKRGFKMSFNKFRHKLISDEDIVFAFNIAGLVLDLETSNS